MNSWKVIFIKNTNMYEIHTAEKEELFTTLRGRDLAYVKLKWKNLLYKLERLDYEQRRAWYKYEKMRKMR